MSEPLMSLVYSLSLPLEHRFADLYARTISLGLFILCIGFARLLCDMFLPGFFHGDSQALRHQSIYSGIWAALAGMWLYTGL
ncbi:MAG: hypothetical protein ACLQU2_20235 [Candidatus Binataceae bacterium]